MSKQGHDDGVLPEFKRLRVTTADSSAGLPQSCSNAFAVTASPSLSTSTATAVPSPFATSSWASVVVPTANPFGSSSLLSLPDPTANPFSAAAFGFPETTSFSTSFHAETKHPASLATQPSPLTFSVGGSATPAPFVFTTNTRFDLGSAFAVSTATSLGGYRGRSIKSRRDHSIDAVLAALPQSTRLSELTGFDNGSLSVCAPTSTSPSKSYEHWGGLVASVSVCDDFPRVLLADHDLFVMFGKLDTLDRARSLLEIMDALTGSSRFTAMEINRLNSPLLDGLLTIVSGTQAPRKRRGVDDRNLGEALGVLVDSQREWVDAVVFLLDRRTDADDMSGWLHFLLERAAQRGHVTILRNLLKCVPDGVATRTKLMKLLLTAVTKDWPKVVEVLIEQGLQLPAQILVTAATRGSIELVKLVIRYKPECLLDLAPALFAAMTRNHGRPTARSASIVSFLCATKPLDTLSVAEKQAAFIAACAVNDLALVNLFLPFVEPNDDIRHLAGQASWAGFAELFECLMNSNLPIDRSRAVQAMLQHNKFDTDIMIRNLQRVWHLWTRLEQETALLHACQSGKVELVRYMLDNGVGIEKGDDALLRAISYGHSLPCVTLLVERGAPFRGRVVEMLRAAVVVPSIEILNYFLSLGIDPRNLDAVLSVVCVQDADRTRSEATMVMEELLLKAGADPTIALLEASRSRRVE